MRLAIMLVAAGIGGLTLAGCVETPPGGIAPSGVAASARGAALTATSACTSGGVLKQVPFLSLPYDPKSNTAPSAGAAIPTDVWTDLQAAFAIATGFQTQLCALNGIFINPAGCTKPDDPTTCVSSPMVIANNGWGVRQYDPNNGNILGRYIALPLGLWNNSAPSGWSCGTRTYCAPPFHTYQTALLQGLLMALSPTLLPAAPKLPSFSIANASADTGAMSVLATLAHEYGHILWYDKFVAKGGGPADPTGTSFCGGQFYTTPTVSWQYPVSVPPGRWLNFGQIRDQSPLTSPILTLPGFYNANLPAKAGDNLLRLYVGGISVGPWASVLAAFSPDEDFVETFELSVLASAQPSGASQPLLQSMKVAIPGSHGTIPFDVFTNLQNGTELARKYVCIAGALPPQSQLRR
jgi:hypothetical protein